MNQEKIDNLKKNYQKETGVELDSEAIFFTRGYVIRRLRQLGQPTKADEEAYTHNLNTNREYNLMTNSFKNTFKKYISNQKNEDLAKIYLMGCNQLDGGKVTEKDIIAYMQGLRFN